MDLAGDVACAPSDHVAYFIGAFPCDRHGAPIEKIRHSGRQELAVGLVVDHSYSSKPTCGRYSDYYEKMTTYAAILWTPAASLEPTITPKTFPPVAAEEQDETPFVYIDTASSRAGISAVAAKLAVGDVAIAGLGGYGGVRARPAGKGTDPQDSPLRR